MQPKHVYLLLLVPSFLSTSSFILPPVHHTKPLAASRLNTASPPPEPTPSLEPTSSPELTPVYAGRPSLFKKGSNPFTSACRTYLSYLSRLLTETSLPARSRLSHMKLLKSIDTLESALEGELTEANDEEVVKGLKTTLSLAKQNLNKMNILKQSKLKRLVVMKKKKKKERRSILFGCSMGALVIAWVFSGNYAFTGLFCLVVILGQLEYYRGVIATGSYPARTLSIVACVASFCTALGAPYLHQMTMPVFATLSLIFFLAIKQTPSTIADVATTLLGTFYIGYLPSFWVRVRTLGTYEPTRMSEVAKPVLAYFGQKAIKLPIWLPSTVRLPITAGAVFTCWCWLSIAFADVGAYFVGRKFGKNKLGVLSPSLERASPNKSVEGLVGGCVVSAGFGMLGAWVMRWPMWWLNGAVHGVILALLGFVGDLTASLMKRDARLKDFGDLIPEHGGVLDRVDSYIFTAPYAFLFIAFYLPWLKSW